MFRKLFLKAKASERAEIFTLTDLCLGGAGLALELATLELLSFGLGRAIIARTGVFEGLFGPALAIAPLCLVMALAAAPARLLRSDLRAGFGLDPRPAWRRLRSLFLSGLAGLIIFWLASWVVYEAILSGSLALWAGTLLGCLWLLVLGRALIERLRVSTSLREADPAEIPQTLTPFLEVWRGAFPKAGRLRISELFRPGLTMPGYLGADLVVTGKALAAFTPEALKSGVVMAIMAQMLKLDRNLLLTRLASIALAVPGAVIILHGLGLLAGLPLVVGPRLMPLVWLAVWLAALASNLAQRHLARYLVHKLNAAVLAVTRDEAALVTAIGTMARYNQTPWTDRWWSRILGGAPSPQDQIDRLRAAAEEIEAQRRAAASTGSPGSDPPSGPAGPSRPDGQSGPAGPSGPDGPSGPEGPADLSGPPEGAPLN